MEKIKIPCDRVGGCMDAYDGDSVSITFMLSRNVHSPVTHQLAHALTTMCDHDIGVVVKDEQGG